ncbi:hypothetical protein [Beduinella massiliensis]|uniref:hypothetical protein n=1 Tax=Beduinella massiliensis TaxID=1852363 RepID=UPI000C8616FF
MRTQHRISATCSFLLACILLFSACGAAVADGKFAPGTYTSCSKGFGGDVTVTVEVSDARIEAVRAKGQPLPLRAKAALLTTGGYGNDVSLIADTDRRLFFVRTRCTPAPMLIQ